MVAILTKTDLFAMLAVVGTIMVILNPAAYTVNCSCLGNYC